MTAMHRGSDTISFLRHGTPPALPPKDDMCSATGDVRFVPIADIAAFFDHLVERRQAVNAALPAPALNKKSSSPQAKVNV